MELTIKCGRNKWIDDWRKGQEAKRQVTFDEYMREDKREWLI